MDHLGNDLAQFIVDLFMSVGRQKRRKRRKLSEKRCGEGRKDGNAG